MAAYRATDERATELGDAIRVIKLNTKGLDFIASAPNLLTEGRGRGGAQLTVERYSSGS